ncbi:MAG: C40 family peptidase [Acidobacteria bacterium]|nr:C40 family peptidase [Acidobacteriota bacterium]
MFFRRISLCAIAVCLCALPSTVIVNAQTSNRQTSVPATTAGGPRLETDPVIISTTAVVDEGIAPTAGASAPLINQLLMSAIDERMGSPYVYGSTGPRGYDCSGFVWSVYNSAGINFYRGSARSLWARFAPATREQETQFGTLVFFNGLTHVGIVVDGKGFYHSSRSYGVIYSPFNRYWTSRIDGFRRVPLPVQLQAKGE